MYSPLHSHHIPAGASPTHAQRGLFGIAVLIISAVTILAFMKPGFHQLEKKIVMETDLPLIARDLPTPLHGSAHESAPVAFGEFQALETNEAALDTLPENYFTKGTQLHPDARTPELFIKHESTPDGLLLHVSTNHFTPRADMRGKLRDGQGAFLLQINGKTVTKFFASPSLIPNDQLKTAVSLQV